MFVLPQRKEFPKHDVVRLADWIELNLLMGGAESVSIDEITGDLGDVPPEDSDYSESRSLYWQAADSEAEAAIRELCERSDLLADHYPLEVTGDVVSLREDSPSFAIYRFLVLLRARQLYHRALEDDGVQSGLLFERLAKHAIGAYVGARPEHRLRFGDAGGSRGGGLPRDFRQAVMELAKRMSEKPAEVADSDQSDYRADVVAWKPFHDGRPGQIIVAGQATISEGGWLDKEPSKRWLDRSLVRFIAPPIRAVAFPETLSLTSPSVLDGGDFSSIPFDRLRLCEMLRDSDLPPGLMHRINEWVEGMRERMPRV